MTDEEIIRAVTEQDKLPIWKYGATITDFFGCAAYPSKDLAADDPRAKLGPIRLDLPDGLTIRRAVINGTPLFTRYQKPSNLTPYYTTCRHALLLAEMLIMAVRGVQDAEAKGDV